MQRHVRPGVGWRRLVFGVTVALVGLIAFGAPLSDTRAVYAAGQRGPRSATHISQVRQVCYPTRCLCRLWCSCPRQQSMSSVCRCMEIWTHRPLRWISRRPPGSAGCAGPLAGIRLSHTIPPAEHFNWTETDAAFGAIKAAGLNVIATMAGNPSWAATYSAGRLDRSGVEPFAEFMAAAVERYDGDGIHDAPGSPIVDYWEIYNEPDGGDPIRARYGTGFWGPYGADYAQMLCAVYPAAKAANPGAKIVLGGMAYDWFEEDGGPFVRAFLDDVLTAGGGHCLDALAFHYYPHFEPVWAPYGPGLSGKANYLRSKLNTYGHSSLPLLVTESGYHSNADPRWPSTPELQSDYVVRLFTQAIASDVQVMIWFSWTDLPDYWAASGLLDRNRQPKTAYYAFSVARRKLGEAAFRFRLSASEMGNSDVETYLFHGAYSSLYVVWANGSDTRQVTLPGEIARVSGLGDETVAKVLDASDGNDDGHVTITTRPTSLYVEIIQ